jgi:hypothetical protein
LKEGPNISGGTFLGVSNIVIEEKFFDLNQRQFSGLWFSIHEHQSLLEAFKKERGVYF